MRVKTSITLPRDLLVRLDKVGENRSAVLERAARSYLDRIEQDARNKKDIEIINRSAARLNREALDVLSFQRLP